MRLLFSKKSSLLCELPEWCVVSYLAMYQFLIIMPFLSSAVVDASCALSAVGLFCRFWIGFGFSMA